MSNFRPGNYRICFKEINLSSDIYVHEGSYWSKSKNYIIKKGRIIEMKATKSVPYVKVKKAKFNEKSGNDEYSLQLMNSMGKVRVHIMARSFISSNDFQEFWKIRNTVEKGRKPKSFRLSKCKANYLSDKAMEPKPKSLYERKRLKKKSLPLEAGSS